MSARDERDAAVVVAIRDGEEDVEIANRLGITVKVVRNILKRAKNLGTIAAPTNEAAEVIAKEHSAGVIRPTEIPLTFCYPSADARLVDDGAVKALMASIVEVGLLQPISVRRAVKTRAGQESQAFEVLAGMHRVKAFRQLGRETIPAFILKADDLHAALILIDENLCRNDLSPAERAAQVAKRKRIYEALYPEAKHGAAGGGHSKSRVAESATLPEGEGRPPAERFTKATERLTGMSERSVQQEARRGEKLGEDTLKRIARTSLDKGEEMDALIKLPEAMREELVTKAEAGEKVTAKHAQKAFSREVKENLLGRTQAPSGEFGVVLEDFEWDFKPRSRETGMDRHAANHYPTAEKAHSAEEIVARTAERLSVAAADCALFMWTTVPHLAIALEVMRLRGFRYVSSAVWVKHLEGNDALGGIGMGHWFRVDHELLLLGVRGNVPCPAKGDQWRSVIVAPKRAHSQKPDEALELIESYFPTLPKIELNRRGPARPGWTPWGNEAEAAPVDDSCKSKVETETSAIDTHPASDKPAPPAEAPPPPWFLIRDPVAREAARIAQVGL